MWDNFEGPSQLQSSLKHQFVSVSTAAQCRLLLCPNLLSSLSCRYFWERFPINLQHTHIPLRLILPSGLWASVRSHSHPSHWIVCVSFHGLFSPSANTSHVTCSKWYSYKWWDLAHWWLYRKELSSLPPTDLHYRSSGERQANLYVTLQSLTSLG